MNRQTKRREAPARARGRAQTAPRLGAAQVGPRALAATFGTAFGGTVLGALVLGGYLMVTDSAPASATDNALGLVRALGMGALGGLLAGLITTLPATWAAMALVSVIRRGPWQARLVGMVGAVLGWLVVVPIGVAAAGFSREIAGAYGLALPGLVAAVAIAALLAPWVRRGASG